jgi:hypothetical protein
MSEKYEVKIKPEFKSLLEGMNVGKVDVITVYKTEKDKVYFSANRAKLHLSIDEFEEIIL